MSWYSWSVIWFVYSTLNMTKVKSGFELNSHVLISQFNSAVSRPALYGIACRAAHSRFGAGAATGTAEAAGADAATGTAETASEGYAGPLSPVRGAGPAGRRRRLVCCCTISPPPMWSGMACATLMPFMPPALLSTPSARCLAWFAR